MLQNCRQKWLQMEDRNICSNSYSDYIVQISCWNAPMCIACLGGWQECLKAPAAVAMSTGHTVVGLTSNNLRLIHLSQAVGSLNLKQLYSKFAAMLTPLAWIKGVWSRYAFDKKNMQNSKVMYIKWCLLIKVTLSTCLILNCLVLNISTG